MNQFEEKKIIPSPDKGNIFKILFFILLIVFLAETAYFLYPKARKFLSPPATTNLQTESEPREFIPGFGSALDSKQRRLYTDKLSNFRDIVQSLDKRKHIFFNSMTATFNITGTVKDIGQEELSVNGVQFQYFILLEKEGYELKIGFTQEEIDSASILLNKDTALFSDIKKGDRISINYALDMTNPSPHGIVNISAER